jgi:hypothetical protein
MLFCSWLRALRSRPESHPANRKRQPQRRGRARLRPALELLEDRTLLAAYVVNTTDDSGSGSLRDAINQVNAGLYNEIDFAITGGTGYNSMTGVATITPQSALPPVQNPVLINGFSQPGANWSTLPTGPGLGIELNAASAHNADPNLALANGNKVGSATIGLWLAGNGSTVEGLDIHDGQIDVYVRGNNNTIQGNFIGTDISGAHTFPTPFRANFSQQAPPGGGVGGSPWGIRIDGSFNTIGTNGAPGGRNVIAGTNSGVVLSGSSSNSVAGNFIGTDRTGTEALGNWTGIALNGSSGGDLIERNLISGNRIGIGPGGADAAGTTIIGNTIGPDVNGNPLNGFDAPSGIHYQGNYVAGVGIGFGLHNITVGAPGQGNTIAYNSGPGVWIINVPYLEGSPPHPYPPSTGNRVQGNSTHDNGLGDPRNGSSDIHGLGIDLGGTYPEPSGTPAPNLNPNYQESSGPNNFQNFPVITAATFGPTTTTVSGYLNSSASGPFTLDFYASPVGHSTSTGLYGEGKYYLGSLPNIPAGSFTVTLPTPSTPGDVIHVITATATDSQGNTSEFSQAFTLNNMTLSGTFALNDLIVLGTPGGDAIAINPDTGGKVQVVLNGTSLGSTTVAGKIYVYDQAGANDYTVNFGSNLTAPINIVGNGADILTVNGSTDPNTANYIVKNTASQSTITWGASSGPPSETVTYSGIQPVNINGGAGTNVINDPGGQTTITGGPRQNTITITATSGNGVVLNGGPSTSTNNYIITMGNLLGPVTINSTTGTSTVTINGPPGSNVLTLSPTQLTGAGQTINFNLGTTATNFTVAGGASNNNQLVVQGTPPGPLTVQQIAPTVGPITAPVSPTAVNTGISASVTFAQLDGTSVTTATWAWGDGTTSAGSIAQTGTAGIVSGTHPYQAAGVYTVTVTVAKANGQSGQSPQYQYVVVYDPSAGFVTGGGWITSPPGAYTPNPSLTGKATFGFESKYQNGATVPTGHTQFLFHEASFSFSSTSYDWLVVSGSKAQFKGLGTINGAGSYSFQLTAVDGQLPGGGGSDKFRIKIWDQNQGNGVIYDNQLGAGDNADPTTVLGGGSITIHSDGGGGGGQGPMELGSSAGEASTSNPDLVGALLAEAARPEQAAIPEWAAMASQGSYLGPVPMEVAVRSPDASRMSQTGVIPAASVLPPPGLDRKAERLQLLDGLFAEGFNLLEGTPTLPLV